MHRQFRWQVPREFNMAEVCMRRWAASPVTARRTAIIEHRAAGPAQRYTYAQLQQAADALSHALLSLGVQRGDRVAIVLPQRFETAVSYMAILQIGAVAMPLSQLFGPDALAYRLQDSGTVLAVVDASTLDAMLSARASSPSLRHLVGVGEVASRCDHGFEALLETGRSLMAPATTGRSSRHHSGQPARHLVGNVSPAGPQRVTRWSVPVRTMADDPAVLIYTSGTTGPPKGALIPHRALIGNLTGFVCSQNWFGFDPSGRQPGKSQAVFWSPADWAWTGGLMDALLPTLYFGRPIVAWSGRFSPELAFTLLQQHRVTHTFLFPTALKAMMKAYPTPRTQFRLQLQALMSAGEAVGDAVFGYCQDQLGVTVNEMFGQTEINYIVGNCAMNGRSRHGVGWPARAGSMGRPYPGHRVAVIDDEGQECPVNVPGDVALHRLDVHGQPDPIFFLGYWNNPRSTAAKFTGDWCRTGDLAVRDADGYLWYQGRSDDVFKAAGYRIGPSEVENCLVKHPAVANAAVVPKPDSERGALVKAYVVLAPGHVASDHLIDDLQQHVRGKLAPYEYPKEIEFIAELPMTTTGKVQRRVLRLQEEERARQHQA
jgi:acetyl-CoA synthetase